MRTLSVSLRSLVGISLLLSFAISAHSQTVNTLYTFAGGANGAYPESQLVADKNGNFYGTTFEGGVVSSVCLNGCGTVFELTPDGSGGWSQTVLYSFTSNETGNGPGSLAMDAHGNLFGTAGGGQFQNASCGSGGCGTVFELSPSASGWSEKVIHSFQGPPNDGQYPSGNILIDASGNLYGTTVEGGIGTQAQCYGNGCGMVWELSPQADGHWKETIVYNFLGLPSGQFPHGLTMDAAGNLYGATEYGGYGQRGTVYKLSPTKNGWIGGVIFRLTGDLGYLPGGIVALDPRGNIFLIAEQGTAANIVEVSHGSTGWTGQVVTSLPQNTIFLSGLTTDAHGNIYGTTLDTVYELETVNGTPEIVTLATMNESNEGTRPSLPIFNAQGKLFGVDTVGQGTAQYGTVYEITP
jgi:uncharacterized repeat protein (TIGR03803 family)